MNGNLGFRNFLYLGILFETIVASIFATFISVSDYMRLIFQTIPTNFQTSVTVVGKLDVIRHIDS